jgi:hypothetical protein
MLRLIIFVFIFLIIDFYAYQSFRTIFKSNLIMYVYIAISIIVLGNFFYQMLTFDRSNGIPIKFSLAFGLLVLVYVPKMVLAVIMFGEDILRVPQAIYRYFTEGNTAKDNYFAWLSSSYISNYSILTK